MVVPSEDNTSLSHREFFEKALTEAGEWARYADPKVLGIAVFLSFATTDLLKNADRLYFGLAAKSAWEWVATASLLGAFVLDIATVACITLALFPRLAPIGPSSLFLKPRLSRYFENNRAAIGQDLDFDIGCGLDDSSIFAVKVGIRGTNDVAWVGRCTNTAAKLASTLSNPNNIGITRAVYDRMLDRKKYSGGTPMWSEEGFQKFGGVIRAIRTTTYWSSIN